MAALTQSLEGLIKELPAGLQSEVRDFTEFLLVRSRQKEGNKALRQDWAGALCKYKKKYTSLDLQHKALTWRGD